MTLRLQCALVVRQIFSVESVKNIFGLLEYTIILHSVLTIEQYSNQNIIKNRKSHRSEKSRLSRKLLHHYLISHLTIVRMSCQVVIT